MMVFINILDQRNAEYIKPYASLQFDPDQLQTIANTTSPGAFPSMISSFAEHELCFPMLLEEKTILNFCMGEKIFSTTLFQPTCFPIIPI